MIILIILIVLAAFMYFSMSANVKKLKGQKKKFPHEVLSQNPKGQETFITLEDGAKVKTIAAGSGSTVVFAHGYGASLIEWNVIADRLVSEGYQIIAFDQLGHGGSTIGTEGITSQSMAKAYKGVLGTL